MRVRYLVDENTPLTWIPAGSVVEVDSKRGAALIEAGIAEAVASAAPSAPASAKRTKKGG